MSKLTPEDQAYINSVRLQRDIIEANDAGTLVVVNTHPRAPFGTTYVLGIIETPPQSPFDYLKAFFGGAEVNVIDLEPPYSTERVHVGIGRIIASL